jgi:hypothetical protein
VLEHTDSVCRIAFTEGGQPIGESVFTLADAKKAGTQNLDKFPRNMLFARAMSNGVRWYCPDVFDTAVYTPDELRSGDTQAHSELPPAPQADAVTGEVVEDGATFDVERADALAAMRRAWKAAKQAGADVPTPNAADVERMSTDDLRMWAATYQEEAQRAAFVADEGAAA